MKNAEVPAPYKSELLMIPRRTFPRWSIPRCSVPRRTFPRRRLRLIRSRGIGLCDQRQQQFVKRVLQYEQMV